MPLTYNSYLQLDRLLQLQEPRSEPPEHDEHLFIIIHQVYELWFKLLLHEFGKINRNFADNDLFGAVATFQRTRTIMKTLVGQLDILETMSPMSFSSFRDRLEAASGFQSVQFRQLEFLLGYKRYETLKFQDRHNEGFSRLLKQLHARSVVDYFYDFLQQRGVEIPASLRERDPTVAATANEVVQEGLLRLYHESPEVAILLELMTDFDEGFQEWRYRHVKLVERTIGSKHGTGGSPGVAFLKESLFKAVFPDLWAIRHRM